jgi:prophage antirepressor-like protein
MSFTLIPNPCEECQKPLNFELRFNTNKIRVYGTYKDPLFLLRDVFDIVEIDENELIEDQDMRIEEIALDGEYEEMTLLTETGFYKTIFQSQSPLAKPFQAQVCSMLKQIRSMDTDQELAKFKHEERMKELDIERLNVKMKFILF